MQPSHAVAAGMVMAADLSLDLELNGNPSILDRTKALIMMKDAVAASIAR